MAKLERLQCILVKMNAGAYGTDAAPVAANAMKVYDVSVSPLESTTVDVTQVKPYLGSDDSYLVNKHNKITFKLHATGAGAAGDVPLWGPLVRASGFSETIDPGVSVIYEPVSEGFEDVTLYFWRDEKLRKLQGARGTFKFMSEASNIPHFEFSLTGLYSGVAAVARPDIDFSGWIKPVPAEPQNVGEFSLYGHTPILKSLSVDLGGETPYVPRVNQARVDFTDRKPTGECLIEEPLLADIDYEALAVSHASGALAYQHGVTAGNIVRIECPNLQLGKPSESESEGVAMQTLPISAKPLLGNDELTITVM